jgi:hypothetical protein
MPPRPSSAFNRDDVRKDVLLCHNNLKLAKDRLMSMPVGQERDDAAAAMLKGVVSASYHPVACLLMYSWLFICLFLEGRLYRY